MPAAPQREFLQGVATARTNSRAAACPTAEGDCLVVINSRGEYRDGIGWVPGWDGAFQFRLPTPAYEMCDVADREAQRQTNVSGAVGYIPPGTPASVVPHSFPLVGALRGCGDVLSPRPPSRQGSIRASGQTFPQEPSAPQTWPRLTRPLSRLQFV
jgi:hypothetical protein